VQLFLQKHFLHWVEAMSLLSLVSEVVSMLDVLQMVISVSNVPQPFEIPTYMYRVTTIPYYLILCMMESAPFRFIAQDWYLRLEQE
jgi:hypothetical protein